MTTKLAEKQALLEAYSTAIKAVYADKEYFCRRIDELSTRLNCTDLTSDEKQNATWHITDYGIKNDACDAVIAAIEKLL